MEHAYIVSYRGWCSIRIPWKILSPWCSNFFSSDQIPPRSLVLLTIPCYEVSSPFGGVPFDLSGHQPQASAGARSIWRYAERVQPEDEPKPAKLPGPGRLLPNTTKRHSKPAKQFGPGDQSGAGHVVQLAALVGPGGTSQPEEFPGTGRRSQQKPEEQPGSPDRLEDVAHVRERESPAASQSSTLVDTQFLEKPPRKHHQHGAGWPQPPEEPARFHSLGVLEPEPEEFHRPVRGEQILAGQHRRERHAQGIDLDQRRGGEKSAAEYRSWDDRQNAEGQPRRFARQKSHEGEPGGAGSEKSVRRSR
mgnify:CR=1 FL=1